MNNSSNDTHQYVVLVDGKVYGSFVTELAALSHAKRKYSALPFSVVTVLKTHKEFRPQTYWGMLYE